MIKLVVTDIDGTIYTPENGISDGVKNCVQELVNSFANPFSAINSESYTTKDLIKISQNVEREKVYQLKSVK